MNSSEDLYDKGWILLRDDRIEQIGPGEPPEGLEAGERIRAGGKVIMPGIVNIHTHVCGSLFKALTEDNKDSFYGLAFPMERFLTPDSVYALSMLGCIETVRFGSTLINDIYHHMRSTARAVEEIGLRGVLASKIYEVDLRRLRYNDYSRIPGQGEQKLEENIRLIEECHGKANGRITCRFGPHATDTVSLELAKKIRLLADKYNVGIHIHAAQKEKELDYLRESLGLSPVEYLKESGLAGEKLVAAHCILVNDSDIRILHDTRVNVAHCPEIMMKRGHFPPVEKFYAAGLSIALGTDWVTMNPWTNMRIAVMGARARGMDENSMNARKVFRMATIDAAKAIGMADQIGSLEKGKKADLVIMDSRYAHLHPVFDDPIATIVYNATGLEVETVIIDGKTVVENGAVVTVDPRAVIGEASGIAGGYLKRQLGKS
ncbi:MAG: amidohydrolase [Spirochaetaceae bacterium]|nr:amidohydrolase [Spirochaetaceae bacterium]